MCLFVSTYYIPYIVYGILYIQKTSLAAPIPFTKNQILRIVAILLDYPSCPVFVLIQFLSCDWWPFAIELRFTVHIPSRPSSGHVWPFVIPNLISHITRPRPCGSFFAGDLWPFNDENPHHSPPCSDLLAVHL